MKRAVLSDVHGNLEALEAVLADVERQGAGEVWSLGDAVGYGPDPRACLELLSKVAVVQLLGNHDAAVAGATSLDEFNINALRAVEWTKEALDEEQLAALAVLPATILQEEVRLVHASPCRPRGWEYIMDTAGAKRAFGCFTEDLCLIGHTHIPFVAVEDDDGSVDRIEKPTVRRDRARRYLVNAGSVGQPRDRDPRAGYVLLDDETGTIEIRRVSYDIGRTQEKMRRCSLPAFLIDRLARGR